MAAYLTDMTHVYEEEYARIGADFTLDRPHDSTVQNALIRAYAAGRGWCVTMGNDDFVHDEDKFREALRWVLSDNIRDFAVAFPFEAGK